MYGIYLSLSFDLEKTEDQNNSLHNRRIMQTPIKFRRDVEKINRARRRQQIRN